MAVQSKFNEYQKWKKDRTILAFELSRFAGVSADEVIEAMCFSKPEGERIQTSTKADVTGKTAIYYRKVTESLNEDWYDFLFQQYQNVKEEIEFFEYAVTQLSGRLSDIICDMVIYEMTWKDIANKYSVSESMLSKYRNKAMKELEVLYRNRDKLTENYFLS